MQQSGLNLSLHYLLDDQSAAGSAASALRIGQIVLKDDRKVKLANLVSDIFKAGDSTEVHASMTTLCVNDLTR